MINKKNLWFLTLFSLILVLSVYYITMPNELLLTNNTAKVQKTDKDTKKEESVSKETKVSVEQSEILEALRVNLEEERQEIKANLEALLTKANATTEEKNSAYEQIQTLNQVKGQEMTLEAKIKKKYNFPAFVKIEDKQITVVIDNDKHDTELANNIMRLIQEEFKEKVYVTVQFK